MQTLPRGVPLSHPLTFSKCRLPISQTALNKATWLKGCGHNMGESFFHIPHFLSGNSARFWSTTKMVQNQKVQSQGTQGVSDFVCWLGFAGGSRIMPGFLKAEPDFAHPQYVPTYIPCAMVPDGVHTPRCTPNRRSPNRHSGKGAWAHSWKELQNTASHANLGCRGDTYPQKRQARVASKEPCCNNLSRMPKLTFPYRMRHLRGTTWANHIGEPTEVENVACTWMEHGLKYDVCNELRYTPPLCMGGMNGNSQRLCLQTLQLHFSS